MLKYAFSRTNSIGLFALMLTVLPLALRAQDVTAPNVISTSPINAATGVKLNQTFFSISFDESVKYVSGQWRIVETATDAVVKNVTPNQQSFYSSWQNVYFPNELLEENTTYHVEIDEGAYEDEAGNAISGIQWTITTEVTETDPPLISSLDPTDNSTGVSIGKRDFFITFNEDVTPVAGDWRLIKSSTDEVIKTASLNSSDSYQSTWGLSFNSELLESSTEYYIEVDADSYQDVFGNTFEGVEDKTDWSFTTQEPESIAPEWSYFSPSNNSTNISLNQRSFSISFNEQVTYVSGDWRLVETKTGTVVKTGTPSTESSYSTWWGIYFSSEFLNPGTEYHIEVDEGSYEDLFGNAFGGVSSGDWTFTTQEAETDAPMVTSFSPAHEETDVSVTQTYFDISLDESVKSAGGEVRLVKTSTGETIKTATLSASTYFSSFQGISFTRGLLETATEYHLEIDAGTYEDIFGNSFAGITDETSWSFTTQDTETDAPLITQLLPQHNATDIEITREYFRIDFDEDVVAVSGQWRLVNTATAEVVKTASITNNSSYDNDWSVNFPTGLLEPSTQYHIEIDAGTYEDVFGNEFVGINDETLWSFTTQEADSDPPAISSLSPSKNATSVAISNVYFQIWFDEAVSRVAGEWRLVNTGTGETVKTATFDANESFRTWHGVYFPSGLLETSTQYHIEMDAGIYEDVFGNQFDAISDETTWSFTMQDPETDPPVLTSLNPANNSSDIGIDQTYFPFYFDEQVTFTSGSAYLVNAETDETVKTATPSSNGYDTWQYVTFPEGFLDPGTTYYILIDNGSFEDVFGNAFTGIENETVWSFTTQDEEFDAPVIESSSPAHQSTGVDISTTYFWARFDEDVKYIKGEWELIKTTTGEVVKSRRPYSSSTYRDFYSISFSNDLLEPSTDYHLQIEQGAFEDVFGNEFAGMVDETVWGFTTQEAETDPPTLISITPGNETIDQDLVNLSFEIQFNERVQYSQGQVYLIETATNKIVKTTSPASGGFFFSSNFSFPEGPLKPNTEYHIEIDAGTYLDLFGNEFSGISDETVWSFTTKPAETDAPILEYIFPDHNSNNISVNQIQFSMTFDEFVKFEGGVLRLVKTATDEVIKYATPILSDEYSERVEFFFPAGLLEPSTQYHLEVDDDVFSDFFDNSFDGIADASIWSFTTQETEVEAPRISSLSPSDNGTSLSIYSSYYYINFDEPVAYGEGQIRIVKTSTGEVLQRVNTNAGINYSSGWNISFQHPTLDSFTDYHIEINAGTFVDVFGNSFAGSTDETTWNFTTRDYDAPAFSSGSLVYTEENSTITGYAAAATDDNGVSYGLSESGVDRALFEIDSETGTMSFLTAPDYESPHDADQDNGYVVEVVATDNQGNSTRQTVVFVVEDKDENSPIVSSELEFSFEENQQSVAYLPSVIDDSDLTFSLSNTGEDSDLFEIKASTGEVSFKSSPDFESPIDSDNNNIYEVGLTVTDEAKNSAEVLVKITILDVDEIAPVFTSDPNEEFAENGTGVVYEAIATDVSNVSYQLSGQGVDESLFTIDAESGKLYFITSPNFEIPSDTDSNNTYEVGITASDELDNSASFAVTITVLNVIESLSFISSSEASVSENTTAAYEAIASADGTITYAISGAGADDALFNIDAPTGEVTFNDQPDFEKPQDKDLDNIYELSLLASDSDGNSVALTTNVIVTDVDENIPVFVSEISVDVFENVTGVAFQAVATDESSVTYGFVEGGIDNDNFTIVSETGEVSFLKIPDFENPVDSNEDNEYVIQIKATDALGNVSHQELRIEVEDVDELSPVFISDASVNYLENGTGLVYLAVATDNSAITYALTGNGTDDDLFEITSSTGKVNFKASPDYEDPKDADEDNTYEISLSATDEYGYTSVFEVAIQVTDLDEASPVFISLINVDFLENKTGVAYQAIATDKNDVTYTMTEEATDKELFTIDTKTGQVSFIDSPDYEAPLDHDLNNVYEIEIRAKDALGYSTDYSISITIIGTNDNEPTAGRIVFSGELFADQLLTGDYEFYDLDGDEEDGTTFQWYRSVDGLLDDLTAIENANELIYHTSEADEFSYLILEVTPSDGVLQGTGYFSESKYIDKASQVLDVNPEGSEVKIMDLGSGAIRLQFGSIANREVLIYSLEGKVVRVEYLKEETLDIEYLNPGVWIMKYAEQNGISETLKFIVD